MAPHVFVDALLAAAALPVLAGSGYLALLAVAARPAPLPPPAEACAFVVLVPAHDEAAGIGATVASLHALDYPAGRFRVVVVADNCTDDTAARARAAGAEVWERRDLARRGKGYALAFGYAAVLADGRADAVVVVDADTVVSPNLLRAFAARIAGGAEAVQAEYLVRGAEGPAAGWRARLMAVAFALYHTARSLGRERLGLSCGLRGNGMAFTTAVLRRVPHAAVSLVEDVEYGVALGLSGVRVAYAAEAAVWGEMPAGGAGARTQRERWERGRRALVRALVPRLLRAAAAPHGPPRGRRIAADLAADLLVPPLVTLAAWAGAGALGTLLLWRAGLVGAAPVTVWALAVLALVVYVARGCVLARVGWRGAAALLAAPLYAAWKLSLRVRRPRAARAATDPGAAWVRTARAGEAVRPVALAAAPMAASPLAAPPLPADTP